MMNKHINCLLYQKLLEFSLYKLFFNNSSSHLRVQVQNHLEYLVSNSCILSSNTLFHSASRLLIFVSHKISGFHIKFLPAD